MVGTGAAILVLLAGAIAWKLWRATRDKAARRIRGAKNPSQLSADEQAAGSRRQSGDGR